MLHAHELSRGTNPQKKGWHLQAASQYAASRPCALINIVSWPYISWCLSGSRVPLIHWLIIIFRRIENDGHKWGSITHFQSNCNFSPKENLRWARAMLLSQMHQNGRGGRNKSELLFSSPSLSFRRVFSTPLSRSACCNDFIGQVCMWRSTSQDVHAHMNINIRPATYEHVYIHAVIIQGPDNPTWEAFRLFQEGDGLGWWERITIGWGRNR